MKLKIIGGTLLFLFVFALMRYGLAIGNFPVDLNASMIIFGTSLFVAGVITFLFGNSEVSLSYCANNIALLIFYFTSKAGVLFGFEFNLIPWILAAFFLLSGIYFYIAETKRDGGKYALFFPSAILLVSGISMIAIDFLIIGF